MHTVELLDEALSLAAQLGYRVRQDWLDGKGGGRCIVRGEKWLFVDLAQPLAEQLTCVVGALRGNPKSYTACMSSPLMDFLKVDDSGQEIPLIDASFNAE